MNTMCNNSLWATSGYRSLAKNSSVYSTFLSVLQSNGTLSVLCKLVVICVILHFIALIGILAGKLRSPPSTTSMVHLTLSSTAVMVCHIFKIFKDHQLLIIESAMLCRSWGFLLRFLYSLSTLAVVVTFFEIANAGRIKERPCLKWWVLLAVWIGSFIISLPGMWTYRMEDEVNEVSDDEDPCQKVLIFDSKTAFLIYDNVYFGIIYLLPITVTVYTLRKFKLRMLYICQPTPPRLRKHIVKVRWAFLHLTWVAALWVIPAFTFHLIRFLYRDEGFRESACGWNAKLFFYMRCHWLTILGMSPFIYMHAHNQLKFLNHVSHSLSFVLMRSYEAFRRRQPESEVEANNGLDLDDNI